jgi:hypothetical protein
MHSNNFVMTFTFCITEEMFKKFATKWQIVVLLVYGLFTQFSLLHCNCCHMYTFGAGLKLPHDPGVAVRFWFLFCQPDPVVLFFISGGRHVIHSFISLIGYKNK